MLSEFLKTLQAYLKDQPYWVKIQPLFTLLSLYIMAIVLLYQYLHWQYSIDLPLFLYFRSYLFKQISLIFLTIGITAMLLQWQHRREAAAAVARAGAALRTWGYIAPRLIIIAIMLTVVVPLFVYLSPRSVSHIRIKFLAEPGLAAFDRNAFVYLLYELNKRQKHWYFEVDFEVFKVNALKSTEQENCAREPETQSLCYAGLLAEGKPFIGISSEQIVGNYFWQNRANVSVLSTYNWKYYEPLSTYDFLVYAILIQSTVIHLNTHCTNLPDAFKRSSVSYGGLFQFLPQRTSIKAVILAAHFNPREEALLLNCFGAEYMQTMSALLTLDWLHKDPVLQNLKTVFGVTKQETK